jgi:hypothetical protein
VGASAVSQFIPLFAEPDFRHENRGDRKKPNRNQRNRFIALGIMAYSSQHFR